MFVGDSFVEGVMVSADDTIPRLFESLADRPEERLQAMNFGIAGVGLYNEAQLIADAAPWFKPDWIILVLFANDFAGAPPMPSKSHVQPIPWSASSPRLLELVQMIRTQEMLPFRWSLRRIDDFQPVPHPNNPFSDPEYERRAANLVSPRFIEMMKNGSFNPFKPGISGLYERYLRTPIDIRGDLESVLGKTQSRLLVAYIPERRQISNYYKLFEEEFSADDFDLTRPEYQLYQKQLVEQCAELGIPFLDLSGVIAEEENRGHHLYWQYDDHLTAVGNRVIAEALYEFWSRLHPGAAAPGERRAARTARSR